MNLLSREAVVIFENDSDARTALAEMNGANVNGQVYSLPYYNVICISPVWLLLPILLAHLIACVAIV